MGHCREAAQAYHQISSDIGGRAEGSDQSWVMASLHVPHVGAFRILGTPGTMST